MTPAHHPEGEPAGPQRSLAFLRFMFSVAWKSILLASLLGMISGVGNAWLISLLHRTGEDLSAAALLLRFLLLLFAVTGVGMLAQLILVTLSQRAVFDLRLQLSRGFVAASLKHIEQLGSHRLLASLTGDIRALSQSVTVLPSLLVDITTIGSCLVYLYWLSGSTFALLAVVMIVAVVLLKWTTGRAQQLFSRARVEEDHLFGHLRALTEGIKELKQSRERCDDFVQGDLQASAERLRVKNTQAMQLFAITDGLGQLTLFVVLAAIVFVLPQVSSASASTLAAFVLTATFLTVPCQNVIHRLPDLLRGGVALRKIDSMQVALGNAMEAAVPARTVRYERCTLGFEGVRYCHVNEHPPHDGFSVGPLDFTLEPGQITYLTGGNGAGKSTIGKLVSGLYDPDQGCVTLNGKPVDAAQREWHRQHVSAVFSDCHVFERCLGVDPAALKHRADDYLRQLQLEHKVSICDGVLSTTRLSQGQRKRLALLMVCLEDRPVYLFDEWAADQEPEFREVFYTWLLPDLRARGKTVLVITHDDRYFGLADRRLCVDYGQLVEADAIPEASTGRIDRCEQVASVQVGT